ncbi:MAG: glycosyltransferase family 2 protein [Desulfobacterales bacterium]|jgi:glycosyltransferase involved in cell wall biosynthesis|nr:glycosyltransferase family 2 protein [Desulfobacterales bacterium]
MDSAPNISVVMSTCNNGKELRPSIDSVLSQTFEDFEFVIINDGSRDPETRPILAEYAGRDLRVRVIEKENQGITMALIDGCRRAQGSYIARMDAGDIMVPSRLQQQKMVLDQYPDAGFVSCWTEFCAPEWEHLWIAKGKPENATPVDLLPANPEQGLVGDISHHGSVMFRKTVYDSAGGYRWQFYYGQDWDLWYRMAQISKYFIVPQVLYKARIFPQSISMRNVKQQKKMAEMSRSAFIARMGGQDESPFLLKAAEYRPVKHREMKRNSLEAGYYFIAENLRHNDSRRSRKYFIYAIRENIFSMRSWIRLIQSFNHKKN